MKILTYNIWNFDKHFYLRLDLICNIITDNEVDIIGLQEVKNEETLNYIKNRCNFKYSYWRKYDDCEEGLSILSNFPITKKYTNWDYKNNIHNSGIMRIIIEYNGLKIGFNTLHLDFSSPLNREIEIVDFIKKIESEDTTDYEILLGDFNSSPNSSIYRYLTCQQSLINHATNWIDLHKSYSVKKGNKLSVTLDLMNNNMRKEEGALDIPERVDWIMLKNPYPKKYPKLNEIKIVGDKLINNITPSDHYGVLCDLSF